MRLRRGRSGGFSRALSRLVALSALLIAAGCGAKAQSQSVSDEPPAGAVSKPRSSTEKGNGSPAQASASEAPRIAGDSVVLTLSEAPASLRGATVGTAAWTRWLQGVLGPSVQVRSARLLRKPRAPKVGRENTVLVSIASTTPENVRAAVAHASGKPGISRAEVDPIWTSQAVPNDPLYPQQWHLPKIGAAEAWDTVTGSSDVVVAVLDSGLDTDHVDLASAVWTNPDEISDGIDNDGNGLIDDVTGWDFVADEPDVSDTFGHGTHVAGLIGAMGNNGVGVAGVAFGVRLMPLVVGGPNIQASAVAEAIAYAVDEGADIINMSFGGPLTFAGARDAIDYAESQGVLLVASAGNGATDEYNFPAVYQEVIAVAALDENDVRTLISHYGGWVDIAAPGRAILSTLPGNQYDVMSGTSQAAPIVSGLAALLKSQDPDITPEQIRVQVLATANDVSAANPDYVGLLGAGLVDAEEAVGPTITEPRAYVAATLLTELQGNGNQQVDAGETATLAISLHFTSSIGATTVNLTSSDPAITVTSGSAILDTVPDRAVIGNFTISVGPNAPSNHTAILEIEIENGSGAVATVLPVSVSVASTFQQLQLPFSRQRTLLPVPSGEHVLVADEFPLVGNNRRVYASFRSADGSFTPPVVLSNPSFTALLPEAVVAPNGDVHVIYYHFPNPNIAFPAYAWFDAATGTWEPGTFFTSVPLYTRGENNVAISLDPSGTVHLAWSNYDPSLGMRAATMRQAPGGGWTEPVTFPVPGGNQLEVDFVSMSLGLRLFAHPVDVPLNPAEPPDFTFPTTMLEFDGSTWSPPMEIDNATPDELAHAPFAFGTEVFRFFQSENSDLVELAELAGASWSAVEPVLDIDGGDFRRDFFGLMQGPSSFTTYFARPVAVTLGSERELTRAGVTAVLPGDRKLRARMPVVTPDAGGIVHAFNREYEIVRILGTFVELDAFTSYFTNDALAATARPTIPVVVDEGDTTVDDRTLSASWSSTHADGIVSYRVAWGTAPGIDDIVPWQELTSTAAIFDLGDQRLLPGQTVYASVRARSGALLSSEIGVSDGITLAIACTAPPWNSTVVYHDPGIRVTYQGATYRNLYWHSSSIPGTPSGAWAFVEDCSGEPVLPSCTAPAWVSDQQYVAGQRVSHNGFEFENLWPSDVPPNGAAGNPWKWLATCQP